MIRVLSLLLKNYRDEFKANKLSTTNLEASRTCNLSNIVFEDN